MTSRESCLTEGKWRGVEVVFCLRPIPGQGGKRIKSAGGGVKIGSSWEEAIELRGGRNGTIHARTRTDAVKGKWKTRQISLRKMRPPEAAATPSF